MKKITPLLILVLVTIGLFVYSPLKAMERTDEPLYEVKVTSIVHEEEVQTYNGVFYEQVLAAELDGKEISIFSDAFSMVNHSRFEVNDRLVILQGEDGSYYAVEHVRHHVLIWLALIFVGVVVFVGRSQGVLSLVGLGFSFLVLFKVIFPNLLLGTNPLFTVFCGMALIIPGSFYLSHGLNRKTSIAILGTLIALVITGILAALFIDFGHLSGMSSEVATFLKIDTGESLNFQGLLLVAILISLIGVLDDVTISQAAIVQELKKANKKLTFFELYKSAMNVGRDHIASMVNTLVLVYAGASLPLLMLFLMGDQNLAAIFNYEFIAEEIIQTLVASTGLVLAVPITTILACRFPQSM